MITRFVDGIYFLKSGMKRLLLICFFFVTFNHVLMAQINWEQYSVSAGVNLFTPTLIFKNENNIESLIPSWQLGLNGDFKISPAGNLRITIGFTDNAFTAEREFINMGSGRLVKRINLGYAHVEADYIYNIRIDHCTLFAGLGLRASLLCYENFTSMYAFSGLSSSAFGGNGMLGIQFPNMSRKPSLQFNYYYSFTKAAYNSVRDNQGDVYTDELKNRAIGFQVFFNLKK